MTKLIRLAGVAMLALALPAVAEAQNGNGNGKGAEKGRGEQGRAERGPDRSPPADRGPRGRGDEGRGPGPQARGPEPKGRDMIREMSRGGPEIQRAEALRDRDRGTDRDDRRAGLDFRDGRPVVVFADRRDRDFIVGCPPGLAKKDNGCLPPGQARQIARASYDYPRYDWVWGAGRDNADYRYDNGYLYRLSPSGGLLGYLPVLGGALSLGNVWPAQYEYEPVPTYYSDYYGLNDRYSYRYADGALYGLDPSTQAISQVAALLTGQQWNVGQAMPSGYDVYNVPYAYRSQYVDSPDSWYRYNDGYVYQVDPTTRLVQAVIQLLT